MWLFSSGGGIVGAGARGGMTDMRGGGSCSALWNANGGLTLVEGDIMAPRGERSIGRMLAAGLEAGNKLASGCGGSGWMSTGSCRASDSVSPSVAAIASRTSKNCKSKLSSSN